MFRKKITAVALLSFLALVVASGVFIFFWLRSGQLAEDLAKTTEALVNNVGQRAVELVSGGKQGQASLLSDLFGFGETRTYLLLLLNNTEMRPGGGFIGAYAVMEIDGGRPRLIKVEGTEVLDNAADKKLMPVPPEPIKKYLGLDRWYFRDSNWSPDFASSSAKALELYKKEKGEAADRIDAVIGLTPTVAEKLLELTGPVTVNGQSYDAKNFTENLEYEVEYGFAKRNLPFSERKKMLSDMVAAATRALSRDVFKNWPSYKRLAEKMLAEKQILLYSSDPERQQAFSSVGWAGEMGREPGDYLLWADANLGALKTDVSIERELSYQIFEKNGRWLGRAKMTFQHKGKFDWRTTRYRDYARVYLPVGSELISASGTMKTDKSREPGPVDKGIENGRQWFGGFISIEPGRTGELSFEFYLAPSVVESLKNNNYFLFAQKQAGSNNTRLTLGLDFGKNITFSNPPEQSAKQGDDRFDYSFILNTDKWFEIKAERGIQ